MTKPAPKNRPASVRRKLANLARKRSVDFGLILVKYGLERILFRLSRSRHHDDFILKGALLFELWTEQRYRPTRDADFLARGDNAPERFARIFPELCVLEVDEDGLRIDAETVEAERISDDADYEGVRVTLVAYLERAKIPLQIDIGFGDIVTPAPSKTDYPTLLEFLGPRLLAYPKETVVAEKLEALVKLGIANTRMKYFYDLEVLPRTFAFEGKTLAQAIQNTFQKRGTDLPIAGMSVAVTPEFYDDVNKKRQWTAFWAKNKSYVGKAEFKAVVEDIRSFLGLRSAPSRKDIRSRRRGSPAGPGVETVINALRSTSSQDSERCEPPDLVSCSLLPSVGTFLQATFRKYTSTKIVSPFSTSGPPLNK